MYVYYRLLTLTLNTSGGSAETIEKMTKEVDGQIVPCNKSESQLKMYNKLSTVGSNPATQSIKCMLIDENGGIIETKEVVKE